MLVPDGSCEREIVVRRSRFIARASGVGSAEEAKREVAARREAHPGCDHVAYAYILGPAGGLFGMSDDREPKGTAGRPILEVLRGSGLTNALVTVARFFGGTKLGTGGLVHAYAEAVKAVLAELPSRRLAVEVAFILRIGYDRYEAVRRIAAALGARLGRESFAEEVTIEGTIPAGDADSFAARVKDLTAGAGGLVIGPSTRS